MNSLKIFLIKVWFLSLQITKNLPKFCQKGKIPSVCSNFLYSLLSNMKTSIKIPSDYQHAWVSKISFLLLHFTARNKTKNQKKSLMIPFNSLAIFLKVWFLCLQAWFQTLNYLHFTAKKKTETKFLKILFSFLKVWFLCLYRHNQTINYLHNNGQKIKNQYKSIYINLFS